MSFIGATGLDENQEQFDILKDEIDANASYINNLVGIPDPLHTAIFGINVLNPGLFGLVERAEVKIKLLETAEEGLGTDLTGLTTQVEGIQTEVTGIQTEVTGIQTEILGIQGEITGIDSSISAIQFVQLPALGVLIGTADGIAVDARNKANRALDIWDYSGDNTYNKKAGNVGIGTTFGSTLTNKLEVQGNINIPTGSTFRINNEPFNYSHLAGEQPVSSKWTNATDTTTNIYYNTGNVGIGITTAINNKLEVAGNLNISAGSKYKINNVNLAFSDLGGSLSYNSLTNQLSGGTNIQILNGVINNTYTYTLPTAGIGSGGTLGGVKVDGSTITINNGVITSTGGTAQVNSDWTQTNASLKSFIQNKPSAGTNISFAGNTITNTITGSPTQDIITLNTNYLTIKDKPDSQKVDNVDIPLTSGNEPYISSPAFTETIRTFTHSGGTEAQTSHTITLGQNTICDILIVGGGGCGGRSGGGGGAVIYTQNVLFPTGAYSIKVGNGGISIKSGNVGNTQGANGNDSEILFNTTTIFRAKGGGFGGPNNSTAGGTGGSGGGSENIANNSAVSNTNIISTNTSSSSFTTLTNQSPNGSTIRGNIGGKGATHSIFYYYLGGGGGGAGSAGGNGNTTNNTSGSGGDGVNIDITGTLVMYGSGGAGGIYNDYSFGANNITAISGSVSSGGGTGAYASRTQSVFGSFTTAGRGGGGGGWSVNSLTNEQIYARDGGSGIVIIKFKTIVNSAITEGNPITHKTLNFTYEPKYPTISVDNTNLKAWYKFDGNYNDSSGSGFNLTNSGAVIVDGLIQNSVSFPNSASSLSTSGINLNSKTYSICFWAKLNTTLANSGVSDRWFWSQSISGGVGTFVGFQSQIGGDKLRFTHYGSGNDIDTPSGMSALIGLNWNHYVITYNDTTKGGEIWINSVKLATSPATMATRFTGSGDFKIGTSILNNINFNGLMEDFRYYDKVLTSTEISQLYNIPITNQYTLSVQAGTSIQVNNQTAQYLSGNYTISVGATQSSVSQAGQTDPYPLTNGSTIAIRYSMLQRITSSVNYKKDGLIKYVPASGTNPTTGTWNIIDIDTQLLTQFAGNLPISRIDGNVSGKLPLSLTDGNLPAIRLDNIDMSKVATGNLAWSRISSQPALSSLSGNLDWSRIDSKPALSALSGSLLWNRIDQGSFYMPVDRWIQDTNAYDRFYLAGNSTTFIRGFSSTIVEFRDGNNNTRSIFNSSGQLACHFSTVSPTNTDHLGVGANTGEGGYGYYFIHVLYNTFTGYHRCYYEDDEIFNNEMTNEEIDIFKNNYKGRIVISTGKIKTDISRTIPNEETEDDGNRPSNYEEIKNESPNVEWYSTIDKDGIMIEDAIPIVQLCRVKKDKRVYGVLGSADRKTNNKNRLIVNSVGEGAICVCNTNGNIENGDYIQSSELLGFGEKQDDDILHNYSVAKAVMDCTFELDSPYYQCYELEGGNGSVRVAFIACTYHCG